MISGGVSASCPGQKGQCSRPMTLARFHFDEHQRRAVARDDVNFSTSSPVAPGKYCVPSARELRAREIFAGFSKGHASMGHDPHSSAKHGPCPEVRRSFSEGGSFTRRPKPDATD